MPFLNRDSEVEVRRGNLPHWRQSQALYFVTFRTVDSLPADRLALWRRELDQWLRENPPPHSAATNYEYWDRFPNRIHEWLDQGGGLCPLRDPRISAAVRAAMTHFDGQRYRLDEFVVAPNHVHVLVETYPDVHLSSVLRSWKAYSARQINKILERRGAFWQRESFDHIVRSEQSLERFRMYIRAHVNDVR